MPYKDREKQREANRDAMRRKRSVIPDQPVIPVVIPQAQTVAVIPPKDVIPSVIPDLTPADPYDHQKALEHMMRTHPVFSDGVWTTPHGITYHPLDGWHEGERFEYMPAVVEVDPAKRAKLNKVITELGGVKLEAVKCR